MCAYRAVTPNMNLRYQDRYRDVFNQIGDVTMSQMYGCGYGYNSDMMIFGMITEFAGNIFDTIKEVNSTKELHEKGLDGRGVDTPAAASLKQANSSIQKEIDTLQTSITNSEGTGYQDILNNLPKSLTIESATDNLDSKVYSWANSSDITTFNNNIGNYRKLSAEGAESELVTDLSEYDSEGERITSKWAYNGKNYSSKEAALNALNTDKENAKQQVESAIKNINASLEAYKARLTAKINDANKKIEELEQKQTESITNTFSTTKLGNEVFGDDVFNTYFNEADKDGIVTTKTPVSDDKEKAKLLNTIISKYTKAAAGAAGESTRDTLSAQARALTTYDASGKSYPEGYKTGKNKQMLDIVLKNQNRTNFGA